ncbi:hypothetical protein KOR34_00700 [Posidoniimonas corsicana]|uniref:Uncharacterized protein n=1 Tax=Posidoniimonas corsicana TaxID=1938618 RepID=A0A5C5VBT5_9BACT|nr:hypothetical protein [Posidoniimonas corsicana]TWT35182.1 hypothetical protein KOR34_00700 [Posidoniimonas corsicana]
MTRRTLEDGVSLSDPSRTEEARRFVKGEEPGKAPDPRAVLPQMVGRKSLTIKLAPQVASDLKRLSLERQLNGVDPHTMQDMAEAAITAWLKKQQ